MSSTSALRVLDAEAIPYEIIRYPFEKGSRAGLHAAQSIGEDPSRVFKTLMVDLGGHYACAVIPSQKELSLKLVALIFHSKNARMMKPEEAERITGYHVGGISPLGQKKRVPVALDVSVKEGDYVIVNGGQRGLLLKINTMLFINLLQISPQLLTS